MCSMQNGKIVAQTDREPGGGQNPTTNWEANESIVDRYGVLIPEDTPPGIVRDRDWSVRFQWDAAAGQHGRGCVDGGDVEVQ